MEFDRSIVMNNSRQRSWNYTTTDRSEIDTLIERKAREWKNAGYSVPRVIFWNLNARQNNIPAIGPGFSYCSGFSMSALEGVLSGKDGIEMMLDVLENERYAPISSIE